MLTETEKDVVDRAAGLPEDTLMKIRKISAVAMLLAAFSYTNLAQTPSPSPTPDSAKPNKKFRIAQRTAEGNIVHKVPPRYPEKAKENHITGDVILGFTIDRTGNVVDLKVLEGDPLLAQAAAKAVSQWKYKPYLLNGEPVEVDTTAKISFRM
jgi:TonB family protein